MLFTKSTATKVASVGICSLLSSRSFLMSMKEVAKIVISLSEPRVFKKSTTKIPYLTSVI